ncbi:hypothetical protein NHJ13051_007947 [Beauveria bassiana]
MAGLAMTVSHEPRMESSLIGVPNDRCPKGRCMADSLNRYTSEKPFNISHQPVATEILEEIMCGGQAAGAYEVATRQLGRVGAI